MIPTADNDEDAAHARRMDRLKATLARFDTTIAEANDLVALSDYEIAVIMDDSSAMLEKADDAPGMNNNRTRWDEARDNVRFIVDIASCFETDGVDVVFLNRSPVMGAKDSAALATSFETPPSGTTPLTGAVEQLAKRKVGERKALLFIITAGVPDGGRSEFSRALATLSERYSSRLRVQIMACTGDEDVVKWLNELDLVFDNIDVTDDYASEKLEVERAGRAKRFTRGDWCLKAMLGLVSRKYDEWDEKIPVQKDGQCGQVFSCAVQ
eukprot:CAMPEP_0170240408 /NCGR_PEP_ID=MMETSP0116_2-20130129/19962_1 /TAXON_ID=400756 /ORGANISM="Durinskia baltica, Strain CSIRO CS-38" /LENGTH=267 /DNA_ID=CAMNT_0010491227 /DNA_START=58 /DNA_END=861 /DNA_ORIENTATION=-